MNQHPKTYGEAIINAEYCAQMADLAAGSTTGRGAKAYVLLANFWLKRAKTLLQYGK